MIKAVVLFISLSLTCQAMRHNIFQHALQEILDESNVDSAVLHDSDTLARLMHSSFALKPGLLTGKDFSCDEVDFKGPAFGDEVARGSQGSIYSVEFSIGSIIAKVENTSSEYGIEVEECARNQKLVAAGIKAPQCYGHCMYKDSTSGKSQHVFLFQKISGDSLMFKNEDGKLALGSTIANFGCQELKHKVIDQAADEILRMINAGFANGDQHAANIMFDNNGQIWLIDHGLKFAVRGTTDWDGRMGRMMSIFSKYAKKIMEEADCTEAQDIAKVLIERMISGLTVGEDKRALCEMSKNSFKACEGVE